MKVRWSSAARSDLADIWLGADSAKRRAIVVAADAIDKRLMAGAENEGESRPGGRRVLFERPLGILFKVRHTQAVVRVMRVWKFR